MTFQGVLGELMLKPFVERLVTFSRQSNPYNSLIPAGSENSSNRRGVS
jgi:hypothetical protein